MNSIQDQKLNLPAEAPVMVLPGTLLFPGALVPLFIFEPRYRAMLEFALGRDRMFCMASPQPGIEEAESADELRQVAGLGLVRACVGREDGTSHLVLQGLARVRFTGFPQEEPFRIAQIQELTSSPADQASVDPIARRLVELCRQVQTADPEDRRKIEEQLAQITDPAILSDVVAHTFLRSPENRQRALETIDVRARVHFVLEALRSELASD